MEQIAPRLARPSRAALPSARAEPQPARDREDDDRDPQREEREHHPSMPIVLLLLWRHWLHAGVHYTAAGRLYGWGMREVVGVG